MANRSSKLRPAAPILTLFLVIGGLWWLSWYLIVRSPSLATWAERGAFGDMFGAIGGFFSGLAFAGIILTVHLQTQELRLQRDAIQQANRNLDALTDAQRWTERAMCRLAKAQALAGMMQPEARAAAKSVRGPSDKMTEVQEKLATIVRDADQDMARLEG
jgi:hypothetical protein